MKPKKSNLTEILCLAVLVISLLDSLVFAEYFFLDGPFGSEFTYFDTPTKWEPGTNSASVHGFSPPAGPGTPGAATFSIMGSGFADASGLEDDHGGNLTQLITSLGVPGYLETDYASDISATLDIWASVSGFMNLGRVADGGVNVGASQAIGGHLGDIRVAAWEITTSSTLAHAYQPGTEAEFGLDGTIGGDTHFDVAKTWVDNPLDTSGNGQYDFFTVALHELGHSLGLGHSSVSGSVMEPTYAGARRSLHADDIAGIQAIYGIPEPATIAILAFGVLGILIKRRV